MTTLVADSELGAAHFREISGIVYDVAGIQLPPGKEGLVRSRLAKRLRARGLDTYDAYLALVRDPSGGELAEMIDALTTNKTNFFRESAHFDFLRAHVLPNVRGSLRLWSAGCSTGEEPYTLAMLLRDTVPDRCDAKILATDISRRVLAQAKAGTYPEAVVDDVPADLRRRHFRQHAQGWEVAPHLRSLISFAPLNLMGKWPMRGPFDAIFCRNVMIYFDRQTQQRLVQRFHELLAPGGYLFVGHSESLNSMSHGFTYVQPAVYRR
jgi:chemotaxis protein methyltransferase CheR